MFHIPTLCVAILISIPRPVKCRAHSFLPIWRTGGGSSVEMVGATGFEPATSCSQSKCSTRLSYAPSTTAVVRPFCPVRTEGQADSVTGPDPGHILPLPPEAKKMSATTPRPSPPFTNGGDLPMAERERNSSCEWFAGKPRLRFGGRVRMRPRSRIQQRDGPRRSEQHKGVVNSLRGTPPGRRQRWYAGLFWK